MELKSYELSYYYTTADQTVARQRPAAVLHTSGQAMLKCFNEPILIKNMMCCRKLLNGVTPSVFRCIGVYQDTNV